jgi:transcriptional regulator with XRE-family HTH domain
LRVAVARQSTLLDVRSDIVDDVTPGQLLREARRRHGLTQRQLAARARTSQAAVSRVERDLVSPSVATLASWLDLMGEELKLAAEPIDYGHDPTLNDDNLRYSPEERIERQASWSRGTMELRRAVRR